MKIGAHNFGGYSLMAEYGLVAPQMRVRFSLSPPCFNFLLFSYIVKMVALKIFSHESMSNTKNKFWWGRLSGRSAERTIFGTFHFKC